MPDIFPLELKILNKELAEEFHISSLDTLSFISPVPLVFLVNESGISLIAQNGNESTEVKVDFVEGALAWRRLHGGGRQSEAVAKACFGKLREPIIFDATAGLARDSFILASFGAKVHLFERHPIVRLLIKDGIRRALASNDPDIVKLVQENMILEEVPEISLYQGTVVPDTVYIDPMYPERKKSALVKKDMRIFHNLVGLDDDRENLLKSALALARAKVVMKLPKWADPLFPEKINAVVPTKNHRFVVYTGQHA